MKQQPNELHLPGRQLREIHLFCGAGGGVLGGILCGHTTVCAVEIEPYCRKVLLQRQRDGILPRFPIWDDVTTFDGKPWRGNVDVVCGGFPCQDISSAGKGAGITGARSGLWAEMARIIGEVGPRFVFVENSPVLTSRGLGVVLGDLAEMGYDASWGVLGGEHSGAVHRRHRIWILAYSKRQGLQGQSFSSMGGAIQFAKGDRRRPTPRICRRVDAVANRVDRLKAIGNGQVPAVAHLAWEILKPK